jgi:hypothetical protein
MITEKKQINTSVTKKPFTKEPLAKPKPCPTERNRIETGNMCSRNTNQRPNKR